MMGNDDVLIVGAGVAGLVLGQGLKRRGVPFRIFERYESITSRRQGFRFGLNDEALDAIEETVPPEIWDLFAQTRAKTNPPDVPLYDVQTSQIISFAPTFGTGGSAKEQRRWPADRAWFLEVMAVGLENEITFNKTSTSYEFINEDHIRVIFSDGSSATGRFLVAADGVKSIIRQKLLPELKLLDVERTGCWGLTPRSNGRLEGFLETSLSYYFALLVDRRHPDRSALFCPHEWPGSLSSLSEGRLTDRKDFIYWGMFWAKEPGKIGSISTSQGLYDHVISMTKDWHPSLRILFEKADKQSLGAVDIVSFPPDIPAWKTDPRLTLMGDAVHSMSPTGGSGASTALVDAAELCKAIAESFNKGIDAWEQGLLDYEEKMRKRAKEKISMSFERGKPIWAGKDWSEYKRLTS